MQAEGISETTSLLPTIPIRKHHSSILGVVALCDLALAAALCTVYLAVNGGLWVSADMLVCSILRVFLLLLFVKGYLVWAKVPIISTFVQLHEY